MNKSTDQSSPHQAGGLTAARNGALSDRVRSLRLAEKATPSGGRGQIIPWTLMIICLLAAGAFGYRAYRVAPEETSGGDTEKLQKLLASAGSSGSAEDLEKLRKLLASSSSSNTSSASSDVAASGEVVLESKGYITAIHQIQLSPQVGGEIIWLDRDFMEGAVYKKGDPLAVIDPVIYKAQLKGAKAALSVAEVNLKQVESGSSLRDIEAARATLKNLIAKLELSRIDERNKRRAGIGTSRDELEKAIVQVQVDEAAVAAQTESVSKMEVSLEEQRLVNRQQVNSASANVDLAAKQLNNCTIVAPTTGIVLSKKAELGGYVNPLAFGAAGYLCEMADLSKIEVELSIQERDFAKVMPPKNGEYQICSAMPDAFRNDDRFLKIHPNGYEGYVSRVMPVADRAKGAMTVRVRVRVSEEEAGVFLKPDMSVIVTFRSKTTREIEKE